MTGLPVRRARLLFDEDAHGPILAGLRLHHPGLDAVGARDVGLRRTPDPKILEWAAGEGRAVVSHDVNTMTAAARRRVADGLAFPGLVIVPQGYPVGRAVRELAALVERSLDEPLDGQLRYLPLDKSWRVCEAEPDWPRVRIAAPPLVGSAP